MVYCSCISPPCVDLTPSLPTITTKDEENDAMLLENFKEQQEHLLRNAMERIGWCYVSIDTTQLSDSNSPLRSITSGGVSSLKKEIETLFEETFIDKLRQQQEEMNEQLAKNHDMFTINKYLATYRGRTAESGAATSIQAEPKQSWEVPRCSCFSPSSPSPRVQEEKQQQQQQEQERLDKPSQWIKALHQVAVMVTEFLQLPSNTLLVDTTAECAHCDTDEKKCNTDLLRVFYYDAVAKTSSNHNDTKKNEVLGSSPHTDWGSWTVVWQDDIGGLQTYCPLHDKWMDVSATPSLQLGGQQTKQGNRIQFVVHVGDVTSIAIGRAAANVSASRHQSQQTQTKTDGVNNNIKRASKVLWPSPRHQVVCPSGSIPRASLVYFAYPPPSISLDKMEEALIPWWEEGKQQSSHDTDALENTTNVVVPYDHYSVLKNQSVENGIKASSSSSSKDTYERVRSHRVADVFAEKWKQVQRTST